MRYLILVQIFLIGLCLADGLDLGLTTYFNTWLDKNGYAGYNFMRTDLKGGSYGGKTSATQEI